MKSQAIYGLPVVEVDGAPPPSQCTFEAAWERAVDIFGWLTECEASVLYSAAIRTPRRGTILEVGSFCGKSTTLLASSGRRVVSVDPLEIGNSIAKTRIDDGIVASLQCVVAKNKNVEWIRRRSTECQFSGAINLLYIDGMHKWPSPYEDFMHFRGNMPPGSLVAFHDYEVERGVTDGVHRLEDQPAFRRVEVRGSMYIGELL